MKPRWTALLILPALACGDPESPSDAATLATLTLETGGPTSLEGDGDPGDGDPTGDGEPGDGDPSGDGEPGDGEPTGVKFDLGEIGDLGNGGGDPGGPIIPTTCNEALAGESSVGCLFYTADLDNNVDTVQWAVVVSNVQEQDVAEVTLERKVNGNWQVLDGPIMVNPLELHEFLQPDFHQEGTGIKVGGAYRVVSDVPIIAYQFNPIDGASSFLSDASMLYPVPSWDSLNQVINWAAVSPSSKPFVTIAAAYDGTVVEFTPSVATSAGGGIPAAGANQTIMINLDAGDTASINPVDPNQALTGTTIETDDDHPIAVFSGHTCANIPDNVCCCDHLEEQLSGLRQWGQNFVAAHVPVREPNDPETTLWQVYASEDNTTIDFDYDNALTGLPGPSIVLDRGEVETMFVTAPVNTEADFGIEADKPIAVMGYMTGSFNLSNMAQTGDPAMIQFQAVEQFLHRYVVLVPGTWINDAFMLTREAGATIEIDGVAVDDFEFSPVGNGDWEVARIEIPDGVHVLDGGNDPFGVVVIGWDQYDSYAYIGGTGTGVINPNPQG